MDPTKAFCTNGSHARILYQWIPRKDSVLLDPTKGFCIITRMRHRSGAAPLRRPRIRHRVGRGAGGRRSPEGALWDSLGALWDSFFNSIGTL